LLFRAVGKAVEGFLGDAVNVATTIAPEGVSMALATPENPFAALREPTVISGEITNPSVS
jgi:hypothetical protein